MKRPVTNPTRLRLWQIAEAYPPDYGGGAAIALRDFCRALAQHGHEIRVLCVEKAEREEYTFRTSYDGAVRIDWINLPYFKSVDPEGVSLSVREWRAHQRRLIAATTELLSDWKPDLAQCHIGRLMGEDWFLDFSKRGIPLTWYLHDAWPLCMRLNLLNSPTSTACSGPAPLKCFECIYSNYDGSHARAIAKLPWRVVRQGVLPAYRLSQRAKSRRCVDGIMSYSEPMAKAHEPHIPGPVRYAPLGMESSDAPAQRPQRPRKPLRFGFMGGFSPFKGIWHILDSCANLKRRGLDFELHLWGPWQERGKEDVSSRGLDDRVVFRGMYGPNERWEPYGEIDVHLMATTVLENSPLTVREATIMGAPSIAPRIGGIPELVQHDVNGLLYRFHDAADLEIQMARLLEEPELLGRFIAHLQQPPDMSHLAAALDAFYAEVLAKEASIAQA